VISLFMLLEAYSSSLPQPKLTTDN
jgi:hypothetical protein